MALAVMIMPRSPPLPRLPRCRLWLFVSSVVHLGLVVGWSIPPLTRSGARRDSSFAPHPPRRRCAAGGPSQQRSHDESPHCSVAPLGRQNHPTTSVICHSASSSSSSSPQPHEARSSEPSIAAPLTSPSLSSTAPTRSEEQQPTTPSWLHVRDCEFKELGMVADVIVASFYEREMSPWKQLYRLGELNRIQQGFPHRGNGNGNSNDDQFRHRMLVAVIVDSDAAATAATTATTTATATLRDPSHRPSSGATSPMNAREHGKEQRIVGFCDLDDRPPTRYTGFMHNPRPYLSDVCVHPDYRRRGIARELLRRSEQLSQSEWNKTELYVRVDRTNAAALAAYQRRGYRRSAIHPPELSARGEPDIWLLRKALAADAVDDETEIDIDIGGERDDKANRNVALF